MKKLILTCDRCGRDVKEDDPHKACLYCYKTKLENKTDLQVDLCPECYGHFVVGFLTVAAARMGIKPMIPSHQKHSAELIGMQCHHCGAIVPTFRENDSDPVCLNCLPMQETEK